jgi:hypothetical protein
MWILPTRSRPANCKRFVNAYNETNATTPVCVRLDECDPDLEELKNINWPKTFKIVIGKREGVRSAMNELYENNLDLEWYGFLADDVVPKTPYWDRMLISKAGKRNISYPNDLGKPKKQFLPTIPCVGGDLVRAIGWFGFPATYHFYTDTIWRYIGDHLKNIYRLDDVVVEHMHFGRGKSDMDIIYQQSQSKMKSDSESYHQWIEENGTSFISNLKDKGF